MRESQVWMSTAGWFGAGAGRDVGGGLATDEPSHIHLPRQRRAGRPAAAGTSAVWGGRATNREHGAAPDRCNPAGARR